MKKYEKPKIEKIKNMVFMFENLKKYVKNICRQCSTCHGCR